MDRKSLSQWVHAAAPGKIRHRPSSSSHSECDASLRLSRGETLLFVSLLSLGLWALIWAVVSLLPACGLR